MRLVNVEDIWATNTLGWFLRGVLEKNLEDAETLRIAKSMRTKAIVKAGQMAVLLHFDGMGIRILPAAETEKAPLRVEGGMAGVLSLLRGETPLKLMAGGAVKVKGGLIEARKLLRVLAGRAGK